ncbi:hypothetical protein MP638_002608 [Amoeboaphelidium occidentale]|nr:hypothetical protein MP638_002608 [Amoeboaphelidium occidentale]
MVNCGVCARADILISPKFKKFSLGTLFMGLALITLTIVVLQREEQYATITNDWNTKFRDEFRAIGPITVNRLEIETTVAEAENPDDYEPLRYEQVIRLNELNSSFQLEISAGKETMVTYNWNTYDEVGDIPLRKLETLTVSCLGCDPECTSCRLKCETICNQKNGLWNGLEKCVLSFELEAVCILIQIENGKAKLKDSDLKKAGCYAEWSYLPYKFRGSSQQYGKVLLEFRSSNDPYLRTKFNSALPFGPLVPIIIGLILIMPSVLHMIYYCLHCCCTRRAQRPSPYAETIHLPYKEDFGTPLHR